MTKVCSKCKKELDVGEFGRDKNRKGGLRYDCKACRRVEKRYRNRDKDLVWCQNNPDKVKAKRKRYYDKNAVRLVQKAADYRAANLEKVKASRRATYVKYAEKNRAYSKQWRLDNLELSKQMGARWKKANPEKNTACENRRRARKLNALGWGYTTEEHRLARWEMWGGLCWVCGATATATDHVIPLQPNYRDKPGPHLPANMRPICTSCNSSKCNSKPNLKVRA